MYEVKIRNADSGKLITTITCGIDDFVMVIRGAEDLEFYLLLLVWSNVTNYIVKRYSMITR